MIRSLGIISIGSSVWFSFSLAININEPYLISLRGLGAAVLCIASVVVFIVLIRQGYWSGRSVATQIADFTVVPAIIVDTLRPCFVRGSQAKCPANRRRAGAHSGAAFRRGLFVVDEVVPLVEKGLIGRRLYCRHNICGPNGGGAESGLPRFQDRRGSPVCRPLIVAADQEGGIVSPFVAAVDSHCPRYPPWRTCRRTFGPRERKTSGVLTDRKLAALGVNHDFDRSWTCGPRQAAIDLTSTPHQSARDIR